MAFLRTLITGFALSLLLSVQSVVAAYPDVPPYHKHNDAITHLTTTNVVKGYPDGHFGPEGHINRAEAVKVLIASQFDHSIIAAALNWHRQMNHRYIIFPDVTINDWFGPYIEISYQNKVIQGYPDGLFKPSNNINFAEALKVILESRGVDVKQTIFRPNELLHMKQGEWFQPYFSYAYEKNLINQNKFYHPAQLITRGEFVEIIYRLETIQKMNLAEFVAKKTPTSTEYTITIPKLGIINMNVSFADLYNEQGALGALKEGLGHYLSPPGTGRKMVLFGHSSGYSWDHSDYKTILRQIDQLQGGDKIYINYKEKGYIYEVFRSDIILASQDYKLIENQQENQLTLYTCWPPNSISHRYVIYGKPVS